MTTNSTSLDRPHDPLLGFTATPEQRRFSRWAGRCGLAASAAYLTTIVAANLLGRAEPSEGPSDIVRYLEEVADNQTGSLVYGIAGIVMAVLFMPLGLAAHRVLHRTALTGLGSLAMLVGLAALVPAYTVSIIEATALASAASEVGEEGSLALYTVTETAAAVLVISFTVGSILTLGIAPLLWGIEARRTRALPTWLSWTGVVVGTTGAVWFVWFLETPAILVVLLLNVAASLVFFIGLSRALLSDGETTP